MLVVEKILLQLLLCGMCFAGLALAETSDIESMHIVENGKPLACIVVPKEPLTTVQYAADQLQQHIELVTGAKLEIFSEDDAPDTGPQIYLGSSRHSKELGLDLQAYSKNAFQIKKVDNKLFLIGNDGEGDPIKDDYVSMGTLLAVYRWLDERLGVRWVWPGNVGTYAPKRSSVIEDGKLDKLVDSRLLHSRLRTGSSYSERGLLEVQTWMRRQGISRSENLDYGHGFETYWKRFGSQHPEWFALRSDGKRGPVDERTNLVQMCISNQSLIQEVIDNWIHTKGQSSLRWVNGIENDKRVKDPACECPECLSMDVESTEGLEANPWLVGSNGTQAKTTKSLSDRYALFWKTLLDEAKKHDPTAKVISYAYADYSMPPVQAKLTSDNIVGIVPDRLFPTTDSDQKRFKKIWDGWKATGASLYFRPNYTLVGYCMPYIYAKQFGEAFKYVLEQGAVATDFDSLTGMWGVQGPNLYVLGRLHARPDLEVDEILDEFYSAFGPSSDAVRRYFSYWENVTRNCDSDFFTKSGGGWASVSKSGYKIFSDDKFDEASVILTQAREDAAGDEDALKKINYLGIWLQHARLSMNALLAFRRKGEDEFQLAKVKLDQFRDKHVDEFSAMSAKHLQLVEKWSGWRE